jgi:hypothetical protein
MVAVLSLDGWGNIAQFVIATAGVLALAGAFAQLRLSRANARRVRVYEYADRFTDTKMLRASGEYVEYWGSRDVSSPLVNEVRLAENRATFYSEWEEMQEDTRARSTASRRRTERRRASRST